MLADLRPASRKQYINALDRFFLWAKQHSVEIATRAQVDKAFYRYLDLCSRHQGSLLLAALLKAYPPLRGFLPWGAAKLKVMGVLLPVFHHPPLPWQLAVGMAYALCRLNLPFRALTLLLQWCLGLRPSEALNMQYDDFYLTEATQCAALMAFLRLGSRRSTKNRRPQVARVRAGDFTTAWLFRLVLRFVRRGAWVCDIRSYPAYAYTFRRALLWLQLPLSWTPHSPRAGWASWRWAHGHDFVSIREDGRWTSDTSLRIYLDTVSAASSLSIPPVAGLSSFLHQCEASLYLWLPAALLATP